MMSRAGGPARGALGPARAVAAMAMDASKHSHSVYLPACLPACACLLSVVVGCCWLSGVGRAVPEFIRDRLARGYCGKCARGPPIRSPARARAVLPAIGGASAHEPPQPCLPWLPWPPLPLQRSMPPLPPLAAARVFWP